MGLAASQARLLSLTARIHDVEYQAQRIQAAKLQLATLEDEVYRKYNEALDATTLTFQDTQGNRIAANFNNLSGAGSINNNIAGNKRYVFRDGNDNIIVPMDVYNGYVELFGNDGCGDPYQFAMHMMGVDTKDSSYQGAIDKYTQNCSDSEYFSNLNKQIDEYVNKLFDKSNKKNLNINESEKDSIKASKEELKEDILSGNNLSKWFDETTAESLGEDFSNLKNLCTEYQYKLFKRGAADIFETATKGDKEDFDQNKFNYYLLWGKLIQKEEGIEYTTTMSNYGNDAYENDSQFLQDMLQSGRITVELANIDNKGQVNDSTTSVASDSTLDYTTTSSIDKKELAKAEAEYEHAMKQIDKKDKRFDMDLNRLETERTALTTEYDSVKKVIQDNIERTFGIFS